MLSFILTILGKTLVIELVVELLRQALYAVQYNAWAGQMLVVTNKHPQYDWYLTMFESVMVVVLLLLQVNILSIIAVVFFIMLILKELGNRFIA